MPGRRYRRLEEECARWQKLALETLQVSATAIVPAAESVHALVQHLPDPAADSEAGGSP